MTLDYNERTAFTPISGKGIYSKQLAVLIAASFITNKHLYTMTASSSDMFLDLDLAGE